MTPIIPTTSYGMVAFLAAVGVVLLPNPVHNLLCLITAFLAMVALFLSVQVEFLAFIFLIVYVGAVAILFLFVIMLLNVKELTMNAPKGRAGAFLIIVPFFLKLLHTLSLEFKEIVLKPASTFEQLLYYVESQYQDVAMFTALYSEHATLFVLITLILLTAMIGAIVLASSSLDTHKVLSLPPLLEGISSFLLVGLALLIVAIVLRNRPRFYPKRIAVLALLFIIASFFEEEVRDFILSFFNFNTVPQYPFLLTPAPILLVVGVLLNETVEDSTPEVPPPPVTVTMTVAERNAVLDDAYREGQS